MHFRTELCVFLLFACVNGCALFQNDAADQLQARLKEEHAKKIDSDSLRIPLKRIIRLNSSLISQPVSENRVRQTIWQQMCESVLQKPHARRLLNENGFRVGVSQPPYPWALESLLSQSHNQLRHNNSSLESTESHIFFPASGQTGTPVVIPDGSNSLVEIRRGTAAEIPEDVTVPGVTGVGMGDEIRCFMRITPIESDDDWTSLRFMPELHFGRETMRLTVKNGQSHLPVRQKIVPLFEQQFEIKLRQDDVVIVGYHPKEQWTTGRFFFQSDSLTDSQEHLLVLQLSQIESVEGRASVQVNYRKY